MMYIFFFMWQYATGGALLLSPMSVEMDSSPSKGWEDKLVLGTGEYHNFVAVNQNWSELLSRQQKYDKELVKEHSNAP